MSGSLVVVGIGPGQGRADDAGDGGGARARRPISSATAPISIACRTRAGQCRHASDNRVELDRARHALALAASGRQVAVVSGGDPGVFAMAAAVFEAVESRRAGVA